MAKYFLVLIIPLISFNFHSSAQSVSRQDSLKYEIIRLKNQVNSIDLRLAESQKKFQKGILVASLGYATTIAGGLMLGRKNDDLGQVLLVTGGATGFIGTVMMVDAFRHLGGGRKRKKLTSR